MNRALDRYRVGPIRVLMRIWKTEMTEPLSEQTLQDVVTLALDVERGGDGLPAEARDAYLEAKQTIVEARRNAETAENPLQLSW
jgi:hypothetical protein